MSSLHVFGSCWIFECESACFSVLVGLTDVGLETFREHLSSCMMSAGKESKVSNCACKYTILCKGFKLTLISFYFASKGPDFIRILTMKAHDKNTSCVKKQPISKGLRKTFRKSEEMLIRTTLKIPRKPDCLEAKQKSNKEWLKTFALHCVLHHIFFF